MILCELPFARDEFGLPTERRAYSYYRFLQFLETFSLNSLFLRSSSLTLCEIKRKPGLIEFIDAYYGLASLSGSRSDLLLRTGRARKASKFDWDAFVGRHQLLLSEPDGLAISELDDALSEAATILTVQNGLSRRAELSFPGGQRKMKGIEVNPMPDVLLYVALDEELTVLTQRLKLARHPRNPVATGMIGGTAVGIISARSMGRVPAAVAVANYLQSRKSSRPRLIVVVGLAGGFPEADTKAGHLLCAETVVDLASRKIQDIEEEVQTKFRRKDFRLDDALNAILRSDKFDNAKWITRAMNNGWWPSDRKPSLHFGPVASVDEVIASCKWRKKLIAGTEKLLGVEMEAGGVCAAAESHGVAVAMIRAVSDNADPVKTDDQWRQRGMITIAELLDCLSFADVLDAMR